MTERLHVAQARLRKHYTEQPEAAQLMLHARSQVDEGITCRVENVRTSTVSAYATSGEASTRRVQWS